MRSAMFLAIALFVSAPAWADSIHGNCFQKKGAPCSASRKITTDVSDGVATIDPQFGNYELEIGDAKGRLVTVFCDGKRVGSLRVEGRALLVVRCD
jgi:hypothetical protein